MNGKEYMETQIALIELGKRVQKLDLDAFLKCIANAEAAAPTLDPTLYRRAMDNLAAIKKLAVAYQGVKTAMQETQEAVLRTTLAYMVGHDDKCDVDPGTLTWKRDIAKGEITHVCQGCAQRVKDANRSIGEFRKVQ
jgi:hypothetical protein